MAVNSSIDKEQSANNALKKFRINILYAVFRALAEEGDITEEEFSKCVEKFARGNQTMLHE